MSIKSILVPLDGSDESIAVLDTAHIVAKRFDARIKAVHVSPQPERDLPYLINALPANLKKTVMDETEKKNRENSKRIKRQFTAFCKANNMKVLDALDATTDGAVWYEESGDSVEVLVKHARLSDVVATFRPRKSSSRMRRSPAGENLEAIMLRSGRPILLVPPKWPPHKVGHAAFAWNESLEASRAVAMTMPWLVQMKQVTVIVSKKRKDSVPDLLQYLALHGVNTKVKYLPTKAKTVAQGILDCCTDNEVEFLVVGGFSQARTRQLVFGGVTSYLLAKSNVLTVMVH